MNTKKISLLALVSFMTTMTFCSGNYFGRSLTRGSSNNPASVDQTCVDNSCDITNSYDPQPLKPGTFSPEIAFIGDTSPSMKDNYIAISTALTDFIGQLQTQGVENFCIGYIPAHAGEFSGLFYAPTKDASGKAIVGKDGKPLPKCMCTSDYDIPTITYNMNLILTNYPTKDYNDSSHTTGQTFSQSGETPLYSLHRAITDSGRIGANTSAGCFQDAYTFAPILVGDENDIMASTDGTIAGNKCAGIMLNGVDMGTVQFDNSDFPELLNNDSVTDKTSLTYNPVDQSCQEVRGRLLYYSNQTPDIVTGKYTLALTPKSIADELVTFNGSLPSFATGVGFIAGDQPMTSTILGFTGQDGPQWGTGGKDGMAAIFGQDIANLKYAVEGNQPAFQSELNNIATALAKQVAFHYVFDLTKEETVNGQTTQVPAQVCSTKRDSLVVKVDGQIVPSNQYTLSTDGTRITFASGYDWEFGDKVVITFETCS